MAAADDDDGGDDDGSTHTKQIRGTRNADLEILYRWWKMKLE